MENWIARFAAIGTELPPEPHYFGSASEEQRQATMLRIYQNRARAVQGRVNWRRMSSFHWVRAAVIEAQAVRRMAHGRPPYEMPSLSPTSPEWSEEFACRIGALLAHEDTMGACDYFLAELEVLCIWPGAPLINLTGEDTPVYGAENFVSFTLDGVLQTDELAPLRNKRFDDRMPRLLELARSGTFAPERFRCASEKPASLRAFKLAINALNRMDMLYIEVIIPSASANQDKQYLYESRVREAIQVHGADTKAKVLYEHCRPMQYQMFLRIRTKLLEERGLKDAGLAD